MSVWSLEVQLPVRPALARTAAFARDYEGSLPRGLQCVCLSRRHHLAGRATINDGGRRPTSRQPRQHQESWCSTGWADSRGVCRHWRGRGSAGGVRGRAAAVGHHVSRGQGPVGALLYLHVPVLPAQLARPVLRGESRRAHGGVDRVQGGAGARGRPSDGLHRHAGRRHHVQKARRRNGVGVKGDRGHARYWLRRGGAGDRGHQPRGAEPLHPARFQQERKAHQVLPQRRGRLPPQAVVPIAPHRTAAIGSSYQKEPEDCCLRREKLSLFCTKKDFNPNPNPVLTSDG